MYLMTYKTLINKTKEETINKVLVTSELLGHQLVARWNLESRSFCGNAYLYEVVSVESYINETNLLDYDCFTSLNGFQRHLSLVP